MKKLIFITALLFSLNAAAQNYQITFTGTGSSSTVGSVKVENLTAGTFATLNGGDILRLNVTTGISRYIYKDPSQDITAFPNPSEGSINIQFTPISAGNAVISVYDINGRQLTRITHYLEDHPQEFRLSGLGNGLHLISIKGRIYNYSAKVLSNNSSATNIISLQPISTISTVSDKAVNDEIKGSSATVEMQYTTGDRLKFTGTSGNYSTVITDIPTQSKTITFNFMPCTDGDGNHYPVVEIGKQIWMAMNLKTTKYLNGDLIGTTTTATKDISGETNPKYQWAYGGDNNNANVYGRLYTFFVTTDGRSLCPSGWFVPTKYEWYTLEYFLGEYEVAGGKLKETGLAHWNSPNKNATNETGFTALPGGWRNMNGTFGNLGNNGYWYSVSQYNSLKTWFWYTSYNYEGLYSVYDNNKSGFSVRCVKFSVPIVITFPVENITASKGTVSGSVDSAGGAAITEKGFYYGTAPNPASTGTKLNLGSGMGGFYADLTGLNANTTYYVMAYAVNGIGTGYSEEISFKTNPLTAPILITKYPGSVTQAQALSGGEISDDGGKPVIARGVCWSELENPTISDSHTSDGTGTGTFTSFITGLKASTKYYVRAYAQNSTGTGYGEQVYFVTLSGGPVVFNPALTYGTVNDVEGNVYKTIQIGTQVWMAENLRTRKYNDKTGIPYVADNTAWDDLTTPAYCFYNNDSTTYKPTYGALYNYYAVKTGKLCPAGWHVVDEDDFDYLETFLGDLYTAGGKMKEAGLVHWVSPNSGATNETGFTGLPGGRRNAGSNGAFTSMGYQGYWWSSAPEDVYGTVAAGYMDYYHSAMSSDSFYKTNGMSVRCIKD
jgi:uncharacterized protein (TIGR02145 family)